MIKLRTPGHALIHAPVLTTERLILRAPESTDFDSYAAFMASDRSADLGGPLSRADAWDRFSMELGHWLLRGFGHYMLIERDSGAMIGRAGFSQPEGWPEVDLGWALCEGFEGRGFTTEAVQRLRSYAAETLGWAALCSLIAPEDARTAAQAERLGAGKEGSWTAPDGRTLHLYRHPLAHEAAA